MEPYLILALLLLVSLYLNGDFLSDFLRPQRSGLNINRQTELIEFLTQHKKREKNYANPPEEFKEFGRAVQGEITGDVGVVRYVFPLVGHHEVEFSCTLTPQEVSQEVDAFGATSDCVVKKSEDTLGVNTQAGAEYLRRELPKGGFTYGDEPFGIDYNYLVRKTGSIGKAIAATILRELQQRSLDSRENRVRAAANFVQFIPYGQPNFDTEHHMYLGMAVPHESVVLSFSDCDSKSVLLAAILVHLVDYRDLVLVHCTSGGEHMILGVAGMEMIACNQVSYNGRRHLLIETTTPVGLDHPFVDNIVIHQYYPLKETA